MKTMTFIRKPTLFLLPCILILALYSCSKHNNTAAVTPKTDSSIAWQALLGGSGYDWANAIIRTSDGGYVTAGNTYSNNNGDVGANHGTADMWIVKLDANGGKVWGKSLGGISYDLAYSIAASADGGYVAAGYTTSNNSGDVGANHGSSDFWIVKLNGNGDTVWTKIMGGAGDEKALSIIATPDGGFAVAGYTNSNNTGDLGTTQGGYDMWIVKLNANGSTAWTKTLGGAGDDIARSIVATPGGGYAVAGYTTSNNTGDVGATKGANDMWIVQLDASGNKVWGKTLGGSGDDLAYSIAALPDGEYVLAGTTKSNNSGDIGANHGGYDMSIVKLNGKGDTVWTRTMGGTGDEIASSITVTPDGRYGISAGTTSNNNGDVGPSHGGTDLWVVELDASGKTLWQKTFGGALNEFHNSVASMVYTTDGGYALTTDSYSNDGDLKGLTNHGLNDMWILKLH
ncbi:MAG TPA: hypothetical protein VF939_17575 [Puia sp.]